MADEQLVERQLFGGAVRLGLPSRFIDVSDFRPVPDNQEVFTDAGHDQSLIVEVVEFPDVPDSEAAAFHFQDLAQANEATNARVDRVVPLHPGELPGLPGELRAALLVGEQAVAKGRQGAEALNKTQMILLVVRLPAYASDLLLTMNSPIYVSPGSVVAKEAGSGYQAAHLGAEGLFRAVVQTLQIVDYGLFGGGPAG